MGSRYRFFRTVWNDLIKHNQKGLANIQTNEFFSYADDIKYQIPLKYEYRPDLIALDFYGDPKLFWVLVYANNFGNSPQDFNSGRMINVPKYERIITVI